MSSSMKPERGVGREALHQLKAFGEAESSTALKAKNKEQYQFWQGWNSALEKALSTTQTECCDVLADHSQRFCPKCGWEFRAALVAAGVADHPLDKPQEV